MNYEQYSQSADLHVPDTMRALVLAGRGFENLAVREVPVPQIGPDQLLARVDAAGVCTSNLKLLAQGEDHTFINGWNMARYPVILGDEGAVTLVRIGDNLKHEYQGGERFAIQPAVDVPPILHRQRYKNNAEGMNKCAVGYTLGGCLAQYIQIQEEVLAGGCLIPLPDNGLTYYDVTMAEPISCVYSAHQRHYHLIKKGPHAERAPVLGLLAGGVAVVRGAGVMGRMHGELALRFRPKVLIVADYKKERLQKTAKSIAEKAEQVGCRLMCISPDDMQVVIRDVSGGKGADDFILALGVREEQQKALGLLADGGVANLFGGLPKGEHVLELDSLDVHYREIKVVGSSGGEPSDMIAALRAVADGDIDPGNYVAAVGSLDNAVNVLRMIENRQLDGRAVLYPHISRTPLQEVNSWDKQNEYQLLNERLLS